jgi:RimJ/RimL family protein N-acetyltransferase
MNEWIEPAVLVGQHITLRPIQLTDLDELITAASDGELWDLWYTAVPSPEQMATTIHEALESPEQEDWLTFVVVDNSTAEVIGSTRFCNVNSTNRRLEIGYTWYAKSYQRTAVNTEAKLLLLTHAFDVLDAIAVEFRTHWHNHQSRQAIARLGAKQDGVLRNFQPMPDGGFCDKVIFSIINHEWPVVKTSLLFKLNR